MILYILQIDEVEGGNVMAKSLVQEVKSTPLEVRMAQAAALAAAKAVAEGADVTVFAEGSGPNNAAKAAAFAEGMRKR